MLNTEHPTLVQLCELLRALVPHKAVRFRRVMTPDTVCLQAKLPLPPFLQGHMRPHLTVLPTCCMHPGSCLGRTLHYPDSRAREQLLRYAITIGEHFTTLLYYTGGFR